MHAWLTSNIWSSLEVWFWRVQLWLSSRFFSSSAEDCSSPRLPAHPQKNGWEKIINKKKKSNFILPFMCKCAAICAFDSHRAPDFSFHRGASHRGSHFGVSEEPGWRWRGTTTIDWQLFLRIPSLPSKQGPLQRRQPRAVNYGDLLPNRILILIYCLVTTDWPASVEGRRKRAAPSWLWPWRVSAAAERLLRTAQPHPLSVHSVCMHNFLLSITDHFWGLHCNPQLVGST